MTQPAEPAVGAAPLPRAHTRNRRQHPTRARTVSVKRMTRREIDQGRLLYPDEPGVERPRTRADCLPGGCNAVRPCPFVSCAHHLYLDVSARTGAIKLNFPDLEPDELRDTCALDLAARGGVQLERVGAAMNLTRERVRQIEVRALAKLAAVIETHALRDHVGDERTASKRRLPVLRDLVDPEEFAGEALEETE